MPCCMEGGGSPGRPTSCAEFIQLMAGCVSTVSTPCPWVSSSPGREATWGVGGGISRCKGSEVGPWRGRVCERECWVGRPGRRQIGNWTGTGRERSGQPLGGRQEARSLGQMQGCREPL